MNSTEIIGYTTLDGEITCPDCTETQCDGSIPDDAPPIFAGAETDTPIHCSICQTMLDGQSLTRAGQRYVAKEIAEYIAGFGGDPNTLAIWSDLTDNSMSSTELELARDCFSSIGRTYTHGTLRPVDLLEAAIDAAQELHDWIACTPQYHNNNTRRCADLQNEMAKAEQALKAMQQPDTVEEICEFDVPQSILDAAYTASDYHGGMGTGLYALSCGQWQHLTRADMRRAAAEMATVAEQTGDDEPRIAAAALATWTEQHPPLDDDDPMWTLESIADTINEHLPAPLYYGAREGDGSDIAIQVSAED